MSHNINPQAFKSFVLQESLGDDVSDELPRDMFSSSFEDTTGILTAVLSISFSISSSFRKAVNCVSNDLAAPNHAKTITSSTPPRYGVEFASEPKVKIMNCWINAPPDFPSGLHTTSMAALPLT